MHRLAFPLLLALVAGACGDDESDDPSVDAAAVNDDASTTNPDAAPTADSSPPGDANMLSFAESIIEHECAPNDGAALHLVLGGSIDTNTCAIDDTGASIDIFLWTGAVSAPQTIPFDTSSFTGSGTYCLGGAAPCATASSGEIHFDTFVEDVSASGTWTLETAAGTVYGTFDADWCGSQPVCG